MNVMPATLWHTRPAPLSISPTSFTWASNRAVSICASENCAKIAELHSPVMAKAVVHNFAVCMPFSEGERKSDRKGMAALLAVGFKAGLFGGFDLPLNVRPDGAELT